MADPGPIVLHVPAYLEHVRLARLLASTVATNQGFSVDDLEDLRLAVGEACTALVNAARLGATLQLTFECTDRAVVMDAEVATSSGGGPLIDEISELILSTAADEHRIERLDDRAVARVLKRPAAT